MPAAIVNPVVPQVVLGRLLDPSDPAANADLRSFERMHGRVLPRAPMREKCYVAYFNPVPTSSVHMDNTEYIWFPVVSRMSGQTVMLACPVSARTPADCLAEFPEFVPYFPYTDLSILGTSTLDNCHYPITANSKVFRMQHLAGDDTADVRINADPNVT